MFKPFYFVVFALYAVVTGLVPNHVLAQGSNTFPLYWRMKKFAITTESKTLILLTERSTDEFAYLEFFNRAGDAFVKLIPFAQDKAHNILKVGLFIDTKDNEASRFIEISNYDFVKISNGQYVLANPNNINDFINKLLIGSVRVIIETPQKRYISIDAFQERIKNTADIQGFSAVFNKFTAVNNIVPNKDDKLAISEEINYSTGIMSASHPGHLLAVSGNSSIGLGWNSTRLIIFDTKKWIPLLQIGHPDLITALDFDQQGSIIAIGDNNNVITLIDIATNEKKAFSSHASQHLKPENVTASTSAMELLLEPFKGINKIKFSHNGQYLASASSVGEEDYIYIWSVVRKTEVKKLNTPQPNQIAFSPTDEHLIIATEKGISIWDTQKWKEKESIHYKEGVEDFVFIDENTILFYSNKHLYTYNFKKDKKPILYLEDIDVKINKKENYAIHMSNVPNSPEIWINASLGKIFLLNYASRTLTSTKFPEADGFMPTDNGQNIAILNTDTLSIYNAPSQIRVKVLSEGGNRFSGVGPAFSVQDKLIYRTQTGMKYINLGTMKNQIFPVDTSSWQSIIGLDIDRISFSPDSQMVAYKTIMGTRVCEVATGEILKKWIIGEEKGADTLFAECHGVRFNPYRKGLLCCYYKEAIGLYDLNTRKTIKIPIKYSPIDICFTPDGKHILVVYSSLITVVDIERAEVKGHLDIENATSIMISKFLDNIAFIATPYQLSAYDIETWVSEGQSVGLFRTMRHLVQNKSGNRYALAYGSDQEMIKIVEMKGDRSNLISNDICTLTGHSQTINALSFLNDNTILSSSSDGSIRIWDISKRRERAVIFPVGKSQSSLLAYAGNYYLSTKDMLHKINFKENSNYYPLEQFDLKYNRPDIVLKEIGYASSPIINVYYRAYLKRLEKMRFTEKMLSSDFHIPEVKLTNQNIENYINKKLIPVGLKATDSQQPLDRLNVFVNDVPIYGIAGINLRPKNTKQHEQTLNIELAPGENKIQVSALNQAGAESLKETFYVTCTAPPRKPDLYFVGIGSGQFQNKSMNLDFPAKDVRDLAALWSKNKERYGRIIIDTLLQSNVTVTKVAALKQRLMQTKVDDHVVLFVAGHGILDDSLDYYLAAYNTDFKQPQSGSIPYDLLDNLLDAIPARQKLMLMDACHAGEIDKENVSTTNEQRLIKGTVKFRSVGTGIANQKLGLENSFELMKELFVDLRRGTGATVIASAGGVEAAMEGTQWNNSVFMYALFSGLQEKKADLNKDGAIMVSELQNYLGAEVQRLTGGAQRPTSRVENITNDWRIW